MVVVWGVLEARGGLFIGRSGKGREDGEGGSGRPCHATGGTGACGGGVVRGEGGKGACQGGRGERGACRGGRGRVGRELVGLGWPMHGVHAMCSTVGRPVVHRQMRAVGGVLVQGLDMGGLRGTRATSRTCWLRILVLVCQVAVVVAMSMAWMFRARV